MKWIYWLIENRYLQRIWRLVAMYANNLEYLRDELAKIDQMVVSYFSAWKKQNTGVDHDLMGLCITDDEIQSVIGTTPYDRGNAGLAEPDDQRIRLLKERIRASLAESAGAGPELRLITLSQLFCLIPFEVDILLISLAPELDLRYEKIYAYLQNDVTKKRPTADLICKILCSTIDDTLQARNYFSPEAPLMRYRLLWFADNNPDTQVPLLTRALRVDERIIRYLLGSDECDERLQCCCRRVTPSRSFHELVSDGNGQEDLVRIARWHSARNLPAIMYFFGPYGTGKKHTAEAICQVLSKQMLVFDSRMLKEPQKNDLLLLLLREAMLQKSCIYFEHFDQVLAGDGAVDPLRLFGELDRFTGWIFISATQPYEPPALFQAHAFYRYEFLYPSFEARKELWRRFLGDAVTADVDIPALATAFRFSGGQILDAISSARGIAKAKNPDQTAVSMDDLRRGCKAQSNKNLSVYARMVRSRYQWGDIVLIPDAKAQLQEICDYIRFRGRVFTDWGFGNKLSLGKGLNILFTGPSGTGKTMAAEIIAAQAGLDLYKIDLSSVVSKYIGETEKNLKNIFLEAETSNAILFFDEADALFGKRTEVRDAHDRYANIEINYLLQKMEEYEGVVILASNFPKNIDEAFRRRMHFSVDFAVPERDLREEIWTHIFPDKTPLGDDIDFTFLSGFKISGGNIKNIALNAAFLAAADSGEVTMKCLVKATRREFQKIGRLYVKEEFGPYYHFIEGDA